VIRRAVFDTNAVISALLFENGALAWLRQAWSERTLVPVACRETVTELVRVLGYPKFHLSEDERDELLGDFLPYAELIEIGENAPTDMPACRDPNDTVFIHLAVTAKADALISGDADLLALSDLLPLPVLTPAALRREG
jgi:putative PIN family toxin of toxin-antitoxin system